MSTPRYEEFESFIRKLLDDKNKKMLNLPLRIITKLRKFYRLVFHQTTTKDKKLEESILKLLDDLDQYDFGKYSAEVQEEWYWVEQEARVGKDREAARAKLEIFLKTLQEAG